MHKYFGFLIVLIMRFVKRHFSVHVFINYVFVIACLCIFIIADIVEIGTDFTNLKT